MDVSEFTFRLALLFMPGYLSLVVCESLTAHISDWFGTKNRGWKKARGTRAGFISGYGCMGLLLELGFLSNDDDKKYLKKTENLAETISFVSQKFIY